MDQYFEKWIKFTEKRCKNYFNIWSYASIKSCIKAIRFKKGGLIGEGLIDEGLTRSLLCKTGINAKPGRRAGLMQGISKFYSIINFSILSSKYRKISGLS